MKKMSKDTQGNIQCPHGLRKLTPMKEIQRREGRELDSTHIGKAMDQQHSRFLPSSFSLLVRPAHTSPLTHLNPVGREEKWHPKYHRKSASYAML
jgi:hypothetical protein